MSDTGPGTRATVGPIVIAYAIEAGALDAFTDAVDGAAEIILLTDADDTERAALLRSASAVMTRNTARDFRPGELAMLERARVLQCFSAGVDFMPLYDVPEHVPIACNAGAFAEPMAEHALTMILAAFKRLIIEHEALRQGEFNQFTRNKTLAGSTVGIFGFGGIGIATARLVRALGANVLAINRRGTTDEAVDFIGKPGDLNHLLRESDALVISAPYTRVTEHLFGARELGLMKDDATLVNLARGELVDELALYTHLRAHPAFTACIDAWWVEPVRHGEFRMQAPFMDLPNVIGSPHNSASVRRPGSPPHRLAGENCRRAVLGQTPLNIVDRSVNPLQPDTRA